MLRELRIKELKKFYSTHLKKDFSKEELLDFSTLKRILIQGIEKIFLYKEKEGKSNLGYVMVLEEDKLVFIHYLAVFSQYRGKGIGSILLQEIVNKYKDKELILLEVEDPDFGSDEKEREIQKKRISFYEKNGFLLVNELKETLNRINYAIMIKTYQNKFIQIEKLKEVIEQIYNKFFRLKDKKGYFKITIQKDNK